MKAANITVTHKNGRILSFRAYEVKSNSGYGRDLYVAIDKVLSTGETDHFQHFDVRYVINYNFACFLEEVFRDWYGDNLVGLEMTIEEVEE